MLREVEVDEGGDDKPVEQEPVAPTTYDSTSIDFDVPNFGYPN